MGIVLDDPSGANRNIIICSTDDLRDFILATVADEAEKKSDEKRRFERFADVSSDQLYTAKRAAGILNVNVDTIYRLGVSGKLPRVKVGPRNGKTLFRGKDILTLCGG